MATSTVSVPHKNPNLVSPTSWYKTRQGLKSEMEKVWAKYGSFYKQYSESSRIPAAILLAFTMIESNGNPKAGSDPTIGLMQWNRNYVAGTGNPDFTLTKEFNRGRLSEFEKNKLKSFGITFDAKGNTRKLTVADASNPELNILIGSIILGQYADAAWGTQDGKLRMDRIIALYNWGLGGFKRNNIENKSIVDVIKSIPATTAVYINKMLGSNGSLDVAVNDMKIS
jgi:soluble lytic murein transglycosylase-like protein